MFRAEPSTTVKPVEPRSQESMIQESRLRGSFGHRLKQLAAAILIIYAENRYPESSSSTNTLRFIYYSPGQTWAISRLGRDSFEKRLPCRRFKIATWAGSLSREREREPLDTDPINPHR